MKLSQRETMLALATLAVVLYGGGILFAWPKIDTWKKLAKDQALVIQQIETERKMYTEKDRWTKEFATLKKSLPIQKAGQKMDVYWLSRIDGIASKNGVLLPRRQVGEEKKAGDLYEISIEYREIEGSLSGTVRFLFDLQTEGVMIDVRELMLKPKGTQALRGVSLRVFCAYLKE